MKYNLLLDDIRDIKDVYKMTKNSVYLSDDWLKAKDYEQFVNIIENIGMPQIISFDHDLAPEHYDLTIISGDNKNGNDCAKWFIEYYKKEKEKSNVDFPRCYIHSMNPVGVKNIMQTLCSL